MTPHAAHVPPPKKRSPLVWLGCLAPVAFCCIGGIALFGWAGASVAGYEALKPACDGRPVSAAAAYVPGGRNRVAGFEATSSGGWGLKQSILPMGDRGDDTSTSSLVVCAEEELEESVERCPYTQTGGDTSILERFRYGRRVRIVAARSGETVVDQHVYGADSTPCQEWEAFSGPGITVNRHGSHVTDQQIVELVSQNL